MIDGQPKCDKNGNLTIPLFRCRMVDGRHAQEVAYLTWHHRQGQLEFTDYKPIEQRGHPAPIVPLDPNWEKRVYPVDPDDKV